MTEEFSNEGTTFGENVPVVQLRSMDGRAASRFTHARRLVGTGGRPVTLTGCTSFIQPLHPVTTLAGITNPKGFPLAPADIYRVEVVIFSSDGKGAELFHQGLEPSDVLTSFWQPWSEDVIGYNFEHEVDGEFFTLGGVSYLLSYFFYVNGAATTFRVDNRVFTENVRNVRAW